MTAFPGYDWTHQVRPVEEAELTVTGQVGSPGAMGTVYLVDGQPSCLYKKYVTPALHAARLDRLVAWRNGLAPQERGFLDAYCAWPLVTVTDAGLISGFLMRSAPADFWFDMLGETHTLELQHLIHAAASERLGIPLPSPVQRLALVRKLAEILAFFDHHDIVYGDVSEKNVLWTAQGLPRIFLIDCDNARPVGLTGANPGVAMARSLNWRDPDLPEHGVPDTNSDRYALAVFCYRVFYGYYPAPRGVTASLEDDRSRVLLPHSAPQLPRLERCLTSGLGAPARRPSAAEWVSVIAATDLSSRGRPPDGPADEPVTATTLPQPFLRRTRSRRFVVPMAISVVLVILATAFTVVPRLLATPELLTDYLASWQLGPVQISVLHYEVIEEQDHRAPRNRGVVFARISIRNSTARTLDLTEAPASLVLVVAGGFGNGSHVPVDSRPVAAIPARMHLYSVGFGTGKWQVLDGTKRYRTAGWAGVPIPPGGTFTSSSPGGNSAIYVTTPPSGPVVSAAVNIAPAKLNILGIAWIGQNGKVLGFCPVSSWKGGNSATSFLSS